jgi:hypothetical protein
VAGQFRPLPQTKPKGGYYEETTCFTTRFGTAWLRASGLTTWGNINPNISTGIFAGATGVIFLSGKPIGDPSIGPYKSEIVGEICFAQ